jgi:DNA modification methylase
MLTHQIVQADAIEFLNAQPADSLDLVFGSPPYEQARLYLEDGTDMGISRKTPDWVLWMADVHEAAQRACKGLVAFVVAGQTKDFRWSAGPALLIAELHRRGLNLRNPPLFHRVGIPGSGGPDWLRSDYEWIVCTSRPGKLPWSDNTAAGHPPKWAPGGDMSHRLTNGQRRNQWGHSGTGKSAERRKDGSKGNAKRPSHVLHDVVQASDEAEALLLPDKHGLTGVPFPEALAEFFVLSFCPPGGLACDPFSGSGTTAAVAKKHGRNFTGCDLRLSQVELGRRRLESVTPLLFT